MTKALAVVSIIPTIPILIFGGIYTVGVSFGGTGYMHWFFAYMLGVFGVVALAASSIERYTETRKSALLVLAGLVSGILAALSSLYFATEILSSPRGAIAYTILLSCLVSPMFAAVLAIRDLVRGLQSKHG